MKKRFFSLILAFVFITSCTLISYASNGFNKAVFDNAPDVFVSKDEMTGELLAASESLLGDKGTIIPESGDGYVMVYSGVAITDDLISIPSFSNIVLTVGHLSTVLSSKLATSATN